MTITIQKTSKNIKAHMLAAACVAILGALMVVSGNEVVSGMGALIFFMSAIWFAAAKIARWWHHD